MYIYVRFLLLVFHMLNELLKDEMWKMGWDKTKACICTFKYRPYTKYCEISLKSVIFLHLLFSNTDCSDAVRLTNL